MCGHDVLLKKIVIYVCVDRVAKVIIFPLVHILLINEMILKGAVPYYRRLGADRPNYWGGVRGAPEYPRVTNKVFPALSHGGQSYFKGILKGAVPGQGQESTSSVTLGYSSFTRRLRP